MREEYRVAKAAGFRWPLLINSIRLDSIGDAEGMSMPQLKLDPKFITDSNGVKTAVVLEIKQYRRLLALIEEAEELKYLKGLGDEPVTSYDEYRKRRLVSKT